MYACEQSDKERGQRHRKRQARERRAITRQDMVSRNEQECASSAYGMYTRHLCTAYMTKHFMSMDRASVEVIGKRREKNLELFIPFPFFLYPH